MPVLFISGRQAPVLSRATRDKLRAYLDRGGFLFAEACCQGDAFDRGIPPTDGPGLSRAGIPPAATAA